MLAEMSELVAIVGSVLTGFIWLSGKMDKLRDKIDGIRDEVTELGKVEMTHVTYETCHAKRQDCPCVRELESLKKRFLEKQI